MMDGDKASADKQTMDKEGSPENLKKSPGTFMISEDTDILSHVVRELGLLKDEQGKESATQLYTGPYGRIQSPFKKYSSFQGFPGGLKRSPRKLSMPAAKRSKLFHSAHTDDSSDTDNSPARQPYSTQHDGEEKSVDDGEGTGEESSDEEKWEIVEGEEEEEELDKKLEDKSSKFSLSAINVKSIIHKIITNESVVEMVRKAVLEEMEEKDIKYEPKLTRSKLKEFEAQGKIPTNWGLSPRKKKRESPNFLEMELPDDEEEDEDFNPDKVIQESDEDSESFASCLSDLGSPMPSTPRSLPTTPSVAPPTSSQAVTPTASSDNDLTIVTDESVSPSFTSPMGPPLQTSVPRSQHKGSALGRKFQEAMEEDSRKSEQEEEELIARRTRSKFPMTDLSILDIEANFVAPDITQDMYDTECDDYDWREFLFQIQAPDITLTNNSLSVANEDEDTEDDPEYNFQAEIEEHEYDREDFRDDRAVKVSKREVNELLDDVLNDDDTIDEQCKFTIKTQSEKILINSNKKKQTQYQQHLIAEIGDHERKQIDDQLRKHVQQLAQTFVMAQNGIEEHQQVADSAKFFLEELESFAVRFENLCGKSAIRACNLAPAIALLKKGSWDEGVELSPAVEEKMANLTFKYDSQALPVLDYKQMYVLWTNPVFMFPELLPHGGFFKQLEMKMDRARVKFLESEDNLLAMGMAQFKHLKKDAKDFIHRFMLPCKTKKQIEIRIKNLKANAAKDNAVKFFKKYKMLPTFPQYAPEFDPSMMKSMKDSNHQWHELPRWCKAPLTLSIQYSELTRVLNLSTQQNPDHQWHELPRWCKLFSASDSSLLSETVRDQLEKQKEVKKRRRAKLSASLSLSQSQINAMMTPPHSSTSAPVSPFDHTDNSIPESTSSSAESPEFHHPVKRKRARKQSRKKLDLKGKSPGMELLDSFVPLPFSAGKIPRSSPLTICVVNNVTGATIAPNTLSPAYGQIRTSTFSSNAQTIIVMDRNAPIQVQSFNSNLTLTSSSNIPQTVASLPEHVQQASNSVSSVALPSTTSNVDSKPLTFEDICRPIMEAEIAAGNVMQTSAAVSVDKCIPKSVLSVESPAVSSSSGTVAPVCQPHESTQVVTACDPSQNLEHTTDNEVQSNEISSSNLKDSILQDVATSPIPPTFHGEPNNYSMPSIEELTMAVKPTSPLHKDSRMPSLEELTMGVKPTSPLHKDSRKTKSDVTSIPQQIQIKKTNSTLEVMASLAPFFISPVKTNVPVNQTLLETTPTKRSLPLLAPKSVSSYERPAITSLEGLSPKHKPRPKPSPRKIELQQQVKTILPKGFVISIVDTSPAKKVASSLLDKAKQKANQRKGYCKIMPRPPNLTGNMSDRLISTQSRKKSAGRNSKKQKSSAGKVKSCRGKDISDENVEDMSENDNNNAAADDDDRYGDTESDYTQSEDGNDTQGTDGEDIDTQGSDDGDSQDSQEEDETLIAEGETTSTTPRFVAIKDDLYTQTKLGKRELGKKDKERDLMLSLLAPDIIEDDPQRDLRDTLFAQAFIHRVKKVLRYDVERLEKFLHIMYHFSTEGTSPIKLYKDLKELFGDHEELMYDFAGFLQPEQAIECGCYKACQEFYQARSFLRKLEICFSKNPNQLQKVMRTFSRWYKKPGRKESDLREQIEPMLKGTRFLLDEFLRFFPNERPSESLMDDFEEINFDGSGDNDDGESSFEEIELLDMEEVYGTKRCTCVCHDAGDDTYKKRKKHCYKCCLTVIDGELVYKINKSTIKKINVTFGPPIKLSTLKASNQSSEETKNHEPENINLEPDKNDTRENISEKLVPVSANDLSQEPGEESNAEVTSQQDNEDWVMDSETAEKENIEHFSDNTSPEDDTSQKKPTKARSPVKESFLERISKLPKIKPAGKPAILSSVQIDKSASLSPHKKGQPSQDTGNVKELETVAEDDVEQLEIDGKAEEKSIVDIPSTSGQSLQKEGVLNSKLVNQADKSSNVTEILNNTPEENETYSKEKPKLMNKGKDILSAAFSSAINSEVSMDSLFFPTGDSLKEEESNIESHDKVSVNNNESVGMDSDKIAIKPAVKSSKNEVLAEVLAPVGQSGLHVSSNSSFCKVSSSENVKLNESNEIEEELVKDKSDNGTILTLADKGSDIGSTNSERKGVKMDIILEPSKSPPFSPFSPFSPFAQEIQSITAVQSPLAAIQSPVVNRAISSACKVRRITPIPVKGDEAKTDSPLSFKVAIENSPVLSDIQVIHSPVETSHTSQATGSLAYVATVSADVSQGCTTPVASNSGLFSLKTPSVTGTSSSDVMVTSSSDSGSDPTKNEAESKLSHSADVVCSWTSTLSDAALSSITIGQPELFSEDANVAFPKVSSASGLTHTGILSEESLFQCLTKPPQFTETLPTVSNLTNILHALGGHTQECNVDKQMKETSGETNATSNSESEIMPPLSVSSFVDSSSTKTLDNKKEEMPQNSVLSNVDISSKFANSVEMFGSGCSSEDRSADSFEQVNSRGDYPQTVESIENLKRRNSGLFNVSHLSDSEGSCTTTLSTSSTNVNKTKGHENSEILDTCPSENASLAQSVCMPIEKDNFIYRGVGMSRSETTTVSSSFQYKVSSTVSCGDTDPGKKKRNKMSRRELRQSLQIKDRTESKQVSGFKANNKDSDNETMDTKDELVIDNDNKSICDHDRLAQQSDSHNNDHCDDVNLMLGLSSNPDLCVTASSQFSSSENVLSQTTAVDTTVEVKTETDIEMNEGAITSDVQSFSDSVSETSSRGRRKSKHKKHKSKDKKKRKKKKRHRGESTDSEHPDQESDFVASDTERIHSKSVDSPGRIDAVASGGQTATGFVRIDCQDGCHITGATEGACGVMSPSDDSVEQEPVWTKETDKTILESCKVHGIKEKTFVKIARQFGNVTPKQVRRRFSHLYQMIFGMAVGEKTEK